MRQRAGHRGVVKLVPAEPDFILHGGKEMPIHRSLTLKKLVAAINPGLMERYFTEKLPPNTKLPAFHDEPKSR